MEIEKAEKIAEKIDRLKKMKKIERCLCDLGAIKVDNIIIPFYLEPALGKLIKKYYEEKISSLKKEIESFE